MLKMKRKLISALLVAMPLLATRGVITTVHASPADNSHRIVYKLDYSFGNFESKLATLERTGVITRYQESIILDLYNHGKTTPENFKYQLHTLVTSGTITGYQEMKIFDLSDILKTSDHNTNYNTNYKSTPVQQVPNQHPYNRFR